MKGAATVVVAVTAMVATGTAAFASWGSHATGTATAKSTTLPAGPTPTAPVTGSQSSANITISWPAVTYVGVANEVAGYKVSRLKGGVADTVAGTCTGTLAAPTHTCVDTVSTNGAYSYQVTPVGGTWTATAGAVSGTVTVTLVNPPAAPTSVLLRNGGGIGSAYINSANASALQIRTALPSGAQAGDQVVLTVTDAGVVHSVSATSAALSAGGAQNVDQTVNVSTLNDGTVTISAKVTNAIGTSSSVTLTPTKDVVAPTGLTISATGGNGHIASLSGASGHATTASSDLAPTAEVCATNSFPCAAPEGTVTISWTSGTGAWTGSTGNIGNGKPHFAQVTQLDQAGNKSQATSAQFTS